MIFKIAYHTGENINLKTRMESGFLSIFEDNVKIEGTNNLEISFRTVKQIEMFRLHGIGRMIRLDYNDNDRIFFTVVRLNLFGFFLIINFFASGKLFEILKQMN